jgi:hypothetical protein|nr:hypothetical protein [Neorhizobium tomejilense]
MTSMDFTFGAPKPLQNPEEMLYARCLSMAAEGQTTNFPIRVVENISIPLANGEGKPEIASFALDFESFITVRPLGEKTVLQYSTFDGTDAGSEKSHASKVWADDHFYMEVGKQKPRGMSIPEYLRRMARDWATNGIEREIAKLNASGRSHSAWNLQQLIDVSSISYLISDEFSNLSIAVDDEGDATLGQMRAIPGLKLGPDPIMGPDFHLTLGYCDRPETAWQERLTTFHIGDWTSANDVRLELVRRHCKEYDSDYGYDWTDARLAGESNYKIRDEALLALGRKQMDFDDVINEIGQSFAATFTTESGDWKPIAEVLLEGNLDKSLEMINAVAELRPSQYKAFLEKSGWTLPFDPLELYELRLRQHRGLDLKGDGPAATNAANGPSL